MSNTLCQKTQKVGYPAYFGKYCSVPHSRGNLFLLDWKFFCYRARTLNCRPQLNKFSVKTATDVEKPIKILKLKNCPLLEVGYYRHPQDFHLCFELNSSDFTNFYSSPTLQLFRGFTETQCESC